MKEFIDYLKKEYRIRMTIWKIQIDNAKMLLKLRKELNDRMRETLEDFYERNKMD